MSAQFTFGAAAKPTSNLFGGLGTGTAANATGFGAAKPTTGFGGFGTAVAKTTANMFGGFGSTATSTTASKSLFGGFGSTAPATGFGTSFGGFGATAKTTATGLFGSTTATTGFSLAAPNTGLFGASAFGAKPVTNTGLSLTQPVAAFGSLQQPQQQLNAGQQAAANPLNAMTTALTMAAVFGDERDGILTKLNQIQALWGVGKGYYADNQQPVEFTMDNPFCRFKSIGYSCLPNAKDSDGLIALELKHKLEFVKTNQQQLVESLHKVLGSKPTLVVCVDGVRELPENKTEVIFYIVERAVNGTSRRIPATELHSFLSQDNVKAYLANLGTESMLPKTSLTESQLENFLENPPLGIDPIIWEQAKKDNPLPKKLIPVPMIGFSELLNRLKHQEHEAGQHQNRLDLMSDEIVQLQRAHATTMAKLAEYKRKHLELGHRILEVMIHQQSTRKIGYSIEPEEEQLRIHFESIQSELSSPMHLKGRLNELMSQIRMQAPGSGPKTDSRYNLDDNLRLEIKQHLESQQNGVIQLINIIKDDMDDLRIVEEGLTNPGHPRR